MIDKRGTLSSSTKGQVTIFIIIGILLLATFAIILFFTKSTSEDQIRAEMEPLVADVPQTFRPVTSYTENCMRQVAKIGLLALGQQGGYIYSDSIGTFSLTNPTEADGINLEPSKVPYWHYNSEPNDGNLVTYTSLKPKLYNDGDDSEMSIEAQLERFMEENLDDCLKEYDSFKGQGFELDYDLSTKDVSTQVGEETVNFLLGMPINLKKGDSSKRVEKFFVKIPLPLKHYYDVASQITNTEVEHGFIEKQGMELISVYSGADINKLPPTSDVGYELFSAISWSEVNLKQNYKEILNSYIPLLRFLGSSNFYFSKFAPTEIVAQNVINNMVIPSKGAEDLEVSFDYFNWDIFLTTNSEGGKIKPEHVSVHYGPLTFAQQRYETHYDISYPVLVTVRDDFAFGGEGYNFVIALESNIRNNQKAEADVVKKVYPKTIKTLACDEKHRDSGLLKALVIDSDTKEPLDTVNFGFTIPSQAECDIGVTEEDGEMEAKYPTVYGGMINMIKPGYLTSYYTIDTAEYQEQNAIIGYAIADSEIERPVVEMHRITEIPVRVKKKLMKKCVTPLKCEYTIDPLSTLTVIFAHHEIKCELGEKQCFFNEGSGLRAQPLIKFEVNESLSKMHEYHFQNQEFDLDGDEEVTIILERVGGFHDEVLSDEFVTSLTVSGTESETVSLVPGRYRVNLIGQVNRELVVPEDERCVGFSVAFVDAQNCQTIDESRNEQFIMGAMSFDTEETYVDITADDLYNSGGITFFILSPDLHEIPRHINTEHNQCAGLCLPGAGCILKGCDTTEDVETPGIVIEDLAVVGQMNDVVKIPTIRRNLEPRFE